MSDTETEDATNRVIMDGSILRQRAGEVSIVDILRLLGWDWEVTHRGQDPLYGVGLYFGRRGEQVGSKHGAVANTADAFPLLAQWVAERIFPPFGGLAHTVGKYLQILDWIAEGRAGLAAEAADSHLETVRQRYARIR